MRYYWKCLIMKTVVVVILYNKLPSESKTLESLGNSLYKRYKLIIVNNGPKHVDLADHLYLKNKFDDVIINNYIWNKSLSKIYNEVIDKYYIDIDRFIILDDDSYLDINYFDYLESSYSLDLDLQIPRIKEISNNKYYYPMVDYKVFSPIDKTYMPDIYDKFYHTIGSGLVIYKLMIEKFKEYKMDIFDENFYLYGVDVSLFNRIYFLRKNFNIKFKTQVVGEILHSLSDVSSDMNTWRYRERLCDQVLTHLFYSKSSIKKLFFLSKIFISKLVRFDISSIALILFLLRHKTHPRNLENKSKLQ